MKIIAPVKSTEDLQKYKEAGAEDTGLQLIIIL